MDDFSVLLTFPFWRLLKLQCGKVECVALHVLNYLFVGLDFVIKIVKWIEKSFRCANFLIIRPELLFNIKVFYRCRDSALKYTFQALMMEPLLAGAKRGSLLVHFYLQLRAARTWLRLDVFNFSSVCDKLREILGIIGPAASSLYVPLGRKDNAYIHKPAWKYRVTSPQIKCPSSLSTKLPLPIFVFSASLFFLSFLNSW